MFTILLSSTRPSWIMQEVEIIFKTNFCAVPLFILVLPVTNSGPTTTSIGKSAAALTGESGLQDMLPVTIPFFWHSSRAPIT
jgi:hypothetical protein